MDERVHALAMRKLDLDAAVLEGVTSTRVGSKRKNRDGGGAAETAQAPALRPGSIHGSHACSTSIDHYHPDVPAESSPGPKQPFTPTKQSLTC